LSPRTRATFAKRQREQARREKQRAKAQRKQERKLENQQAMEIAAPDQTGDETTPASGESPVSQMDSDGPLSETQPEERGNDS
jgi:hypothetical protein